VYPEDESIAQILADVGLISHADLARQWKVLPIFKRENQLTVAIANPLDIETVDKLCETLSLTIQPVVSCLSDIEAALDRYYGR